MSSTLASGTVDDDSVANLQGHSITYRIAAGQHSRSMPVWPPNPGNGTSWSGCAAISQDRPYPKSACH